MPRRRVLAFLPQQRGEVKNKVQKKLRRHLTSGRLKRTDTFCDECLLHGNVPIESYTVI